MKLVFICAFVLSILSSAAQARDAADRLQGYFDEQAPPGLSTFLPEANNSANIDWAQPPLGCVEEMVPTLPSRACLDLTQTANPLRDWPSSLSAEDKQFWYSHRRMLVYCRAQELWNRETAHPGSQNAGGLENAWLMLEAVKHSQEKMDAIYEANKTYGVPLHILLGALYQESLFAELGISDDGGNFSCGMEQINLIGWCEWVNQQSPEQKAAVGWPAGNVACDNANIVNLEFVRPLYNIAMKRLNGLPEYRLVKSHFQNIPLSSVVDKWPAASSETQNLRYQLIRSFIDNCSEPRLGIMATANELALAYRSFVSDAFKAKDHYAPGEHFKRECQAQDSGTTYPLHTGWLLAVAAYNAGPRVMELASHYNKWSSAAFNDPDAIQGFMGDKLIQSLYWGGVYNHVTDKIDFNSFSRGASRSIPWFKACVVQRHVARVMQHVTLLPEFFVDTLEGQYHCAKSVFDNSGKLIKSAVPPFRQVSSGVIER